MRTPDAYRRRPAGGRPPPSRLYVALGWADAGPLYAIAALGTVRAASRAAAWEFAYVRWPERAARGGGSLRLRAASSCRRTHLIAALATDAAADGAEPKTDAG
ncbi:hypothetical protein [Roseisolibacter agri]|uniref:Uncharacterized protein n=1 Tax=Roseisolibacter agri TaxID=2014610 RepID=A0AA37QDF0_9BACT|nr:hypothetical protein [Roseisolibacter agri]GLC28292.1 hypothetical protein rosag_48050 [Roseisolibacter agri]